MLIRIGSENAAIVKSKVPGCFHDLVTSFFFPPVRKERTTLVPSVLRPEVLAARREGVPDWLVPQKVVGRYPDIEWYVYHPEGCFLRWWRVGHDVTCFRHRDEVAGWRGLAPFMEWCRASCASARRRRSGRSAWSRRPQPAGHAPPRRHHRPPACRDGFHGTGPPMAKAAEGAVGVLYRKDLAEAKDPADVRDSKVAEFNEKFANPYIAAQRGFIDEVIEPSMTRPKLIRALSLLRNKRDTNPPRKHGNIPL